MTIQFNLDTGFRGIEWCDITINPIGGCKHECKWEMPDGTIVGCWAKGLAEHGVAKKAYPHGFEHHYFRAHALRTLSAGEEPLLIFPDSMSDLFAVNVPQDDVEAVLGAMQQAPHHTYQSLTKAAPQILKYVDQLPPNVWVGVSSPPDWFMGHRLSQKQQEAMLRRSLEILAEVKTKTGNIVWMSAEPVSWDLTAVIDENHPLDWAVIGAASKGKKYFQPDPEHVRKLLKLMDTTKTPVFFKGNIGPLFEAHDFGTAALNRWREDFPITDNRGPIAAVAARQRNCLKYGWTVSAGYPVELLPNPVSALGGKPPLSSERSSVRSRKAAPDSARSAMAKKAAANWTPPLSGLDLAQIQEVVHSVEQAGTAAERRGARGELARRFRVEPNTIDWVKATRTRAVKAGFAWPFELNS